MKKNEKNSLQEEKITLKEIFYSFMVIMPPAFLFALKNDLPHVFIITFILLLLPLFRKRPLPAKDRPVIYCIVAGMLLTALPDLMFTADDARMGLLDVLIRSTLVLPFLLYMASLGGLFARSGRLVGVRAALALTGMLLCGDRFNSKDAHNVLLGFFDTLLKEYFSIYLYCVILQGVFLPLFLCGIYKKNEKENGERKEEQILRRKSVFLYGVFTLLFLFFTLFSYRFIQKNPSFLRSVEIYFMRLGSRGMQKGFKSGKNMLSRNVDLRAPLPPWFGQLPDEILFHVKAEFPPGLMRSGVYTLYEHGRWLPHKKDNDIPLESVRRTGLLSFNTFRPAGADIEEQRKNDPEFDMEKDFTWEKKELKMEFFPDSLVSGSIVPMPGNTVRIDAVADSARITAEGVLHLKHWKKDGGVTFFVREADGEASFNIFLEKEEKTKKNIYGEKLLPEEEKRLLQVPNAIRQYTWKVCPQSREKSLSGRKKMETIQKFLRENFSYSLYVPYKGRKDFFKDPVMRFLLETGKGHCELFASAAVLMCRAAGLPARYVTGFVCDEKSPTGKYYICRLAHAWAEIYLPEERKWVTLDATPPAEVLLRKESKRKNFFRKWMQYLNFSGQDLFAMIRRGYFAETAARLLLLLWKGFFLLFTTLWGWSLLTVAGLLFSVWWIRRKKRRIRKEFLAEERMVVRKKWLKFEKRFAVLTGKKRPEEMPVKEFYSFFTVPGLKEFVEEYEKIRFGSPESSDNTILLQKMEKNMQKLLSFIEKEGAKYDKWQ